eukprot:CAMPEP_0204649616 /NCGR_PEP_ID=MMETSP0718-20130828/10029_1 /ASSEMBLY_ACC=CAM_ASM_000674 /TAXON_ID=230516 /ORGANISM="Chaetoceros curvisetus" /LENGTH=32 /DNA_ID= /DNA_START= /DNA_END= /DNA_ORIENTATION=
MTTSSMIAPFNKSFQTDSQFHPAFFVFYGEVK